MKRQSLGLIETWGYLPAVEAVDAGMKSADVTFAGYEITKTALVTVKFVGDVAAVTAAVRAGMTAAEKVGKVIATHVIPRPDPQLKITPPTPEAPLKKKKPPPPAAEKAKPETPAVDADGVKKAKKAAKSAPAAKPKETEKEKSKEVSLPVKKEAKAKKAAPRPQKKKAKKSAKPKPASGKKRKKPVQPKKKK